MANTQNLKQFTKGQDSRRNTNGRPPKFLSTLKGQGWTNSEINDCLSIMLALTKSDLEDIAENEDGTILERIVAQSILNTMEKGNLRFLEMILDRLLGKPKIQR